MKTCDQWMNTTMQAKTDMVNDAITTHIDAETLHEQRYLLQIEYVMIFINLIERKWKRNSSSDF